MAGCVVEEAFAPAQFAGAGTRKGFQHTRWRLDGGRCDFELVNVHLIHDRDNTATLAGEETPYAVERRAALSRALSRGARSLRGGARAGLCGDGQYGLSLRAAACAFLRCDGEDLRVVASEGRGDARGDAPARCVEIDARPGTPGVDAAAKVFVSPEELSFLPSGAPFLARWADFRASDRELPKLGLGLSEPAPVAFAPTYRWDHARGSSGEGREQPKRGAEYDSPFSAKRCPGWCDRVLLTSTIAALLRGQGQLEYGSFSSSADTGDHKAVFLGCAL
jgi:hypothetical protein